MSILRQIVVFPHKKVINRYTERMNRFLQYLNLLFRNLEDKNEGWFNGSQFQGPVHRITNT